MARNPRWGGASLVLMTQEIDETGESMQCFMGLCPNDQAHIRYVRNTALSLAALSLVISTQAQIHNASGSFREVAGKLIL